MKNLKIYRPVLLCLLVLSISLTILFSQGQRKDIIYLYTDDRINQEVIRVIPSGTSIFEAKRIMVKNGFSCSMKQTLDCELITPGGFGFKGTVWFIEFAKKDERVVNVKASVSPAPHREW